MEGRARSQDWSLSCTGGGTERVKRRPIADPLLDSPAHGTKYYRASVYRLLGAIFLGVGSDDGNLMRIRPVGWQARLEMRRA